MASLRCFTETDRNAVINSIINTSTSKAAWSFSKQKRFSTQPSVCPELMYISNYSAIKDQNRNFGLSKRRVFTETSVAPGPTAYYPKGEIESNACSFAISRDNCKANSYIDSTKMQLPGPGTYMTKDLESNRLNKKEAYTMRPKTAHSRTYFIENREQAEVPSPFNYCVANFFDKSKQVVSKYKQPASGGVCLNSKTARFSLDKNEIPGPCNYYQRPVSHYSKRGAKIGYAKRLSFIDEIQNLQAMRPGPGKYKLPSEFGHYVKLK